MVKNLFMYIFIYTLLVGCGTDNVLNSECNSDCFLEVEAPDLQMDGNGYYHIEWLEGYTQTFSTLDAKTGINGYQKVYWSSDMGIEYAGEFISCVNHSSYTNENDGIAHTVLSVWEGMVGDTIMVYAGYTDWCDFWYIDSIKVVVDNEI
jgi:hypothetical protein